MYVLYTWYGRKSKYMGLHTNWCNGMNNIPDGAPQETDCRYWMTAGSGFCSNHLSLIVGTLRLSWLRNPFSSKIPNQPLRRVYERNLVLKSSKYVELVPSLVGFGGAVVFMGLQSLIWFMSTFCVLPCLVSLWHLLFWFLHTNGSPSSRKLTSSDMTFQCTNSDQLESEPVPHISQFLRLPTKVNYPIHVVAGFFLPVLKELKTKHA